MGEHDAHRPASPPPAVPPPEPRQGLLLFAHGARDPRWAAPFEAVQARVQALAPGLHVRLAYLELMSPSMQQAGQALAAEGCAAVTVVPLFLGAGGHVRQDVPARLAELAAAHPAVTWQLAPAIGELEPVIEAMARAAIAAPAPPAGAPSAPDPTPPPR